MRYARLAAVLVAGVLATAGLTAESKPDVETKPEKKAETKVDKALAKEEHPHGFYLDAGINALIFNPPERKSLPIYDTTGGAALALPNQTRYEDDALAAYPRLAFGYEFAQDATPAVLGEDLRVEFSAAFFQTDMSETKGMILPTRHVGTSVALGMLYGTGGDGSAAILNRSDAQGITGMPLHFAADYDHLDLNLGMRTAYTLVKSRLLISPYIGFTRQTFDQELSLSTQRLQNIGAAGPTNPRYRASEKFDTEAYGATFGLDFKVKILRRLSFTAGGTVSPLWASTDMRLSYFGDTFDFVRNSRVGVTSGLKDSEDRFTFRAGAKAAFSYEVNKWLVITASGGMDYWDYVPQVKYPQYLPNEAVMLGGANSAIRAPTIGHDNMLNWMGGLNFTVRFGCP